MSYLNIYVQSVPRFILQVHLKSFRSVNQLLKNPVTLIISKPNFSNIFLNFSYRSKCYIYNLLYMYLIRFDKENI